MEQCDIWGAVQRGVEAVIEAAPQLLLQVREKLFCSVFIGANALLCPLASLSVSPSVCLAPSVCLFIGCIDYRGMRLPLRTLLKPQHASLYSSGLCDGENKPRFWFASFKYGQLHSNGRIHCNHCHVRSFTVSGYL